MFVQENDLYTDVTSIVHNLFFILKKASNNLNSTLFYIHLNKKSAKNQNLRYNPYKFNQSNNNIIKFWAVILLSESKILV